MRHRHETGRDLRRVAEEKFGWSRLRDEQLLAMEHVLAGHDVLAVLPTGAGKSAIYQVPALLLDGPTLVVSPLIALQHDQLDGIDDSDAPPAVAVNSARRGAENRHAWESVRDGSAEYVFLSPEQLAKDDVVDELAGLGVSLFVVDEAHCVSMWGHDFRPDYLRLAPAVERLGHPRVIALTATAAPPVRRDIAERLGLLDHREVVASFDRPNLHLAVTRHTGDDEKRDAVVDRVLALAEDPATRPGLLYTATRKDTEAHADELARHGVRVAAYHAGMKAGERDRVHREFMAGDLDVVVATSAFGMGIDKPDVRFVVHASVPDSLDSYYQQIGRAGRDGEPAAITLFYRPEDLGLQKFLTAATAPEDALVEVADALDRHDRPVRPAELTDEVSPARRTRAVNLFEQAGVVTTTEGGRLDPEPGLDQDDAVARATEAAETHQRMIRSRLHMLTGYAETTGCRRQFLLGYFGEQLEQPCGNCDTCDAGTAETRRPGTDRFPRNSTVRHTEWGRGVVLSVEEDRLTVLFEHEGYRTLSVRAVEENDLLTQDG
ncbi:RecQ family ATP-dependent DNA helicase [Actinophytocola gossypii]|uniref:RecQ family ATP-dependent DNA helicase n=1 Tax=Actinophytocola gossypii TaxID=2812003 RepID=UPI0021A91F52|nr:RecQ family ATP-dependent DNA helicase [Actinophytocola gossypii]